MTQLPGRRYGAKFLGGVLDVRQVGRTVAQRRRHRDHGDVERVDLGDGLHDMEACRLERLAEEVVGDVFDVAAAASTSDRKRVGSTSTPTTSNPAPAALQGDGSPT